MRVSVLPLASGLPAAMSATREAGARRPASLSFRRLSSSWRAQAATKEHWSYLPILNVMKGGGTVYEISPALSVFRAVVDMVRHRTGSLLVTQEGKIAGIVTERDILEKLPFGVGKSRSMTVSSIMTPADKLVTASPSFTLEKCIQTMQSGTFRHLPVVDNDKVKTLISMRDISQQISFTLSKTPLTEPPLVSELMSGKGSKGCIEVAASASVADAVRKMQQAKAGSVLVSFDGSFGLFTERDYLTKVAVYDEESAEDILLGDVCTRAEVIRSVSADSPVTECLSLMLAGGFRHVPVTDKKKPVGVISMRDVTRFFLAP